MKDVPKHISDWIKMKSSLTDIIKFTSEVIDHIETQEIPKEEFKRVLYKFVQRLHMNFVVISNSWGDYLANSKFRHPIYLLLRGLISDYITMFYLLDGLKINRRKKQIIETGFLDRYYEVSHSYFGKVHRELTNHVKAGISPRTMNRFMNSEKRMYPHHFELGDKINLKKIEDLPPGTMIKKLKKSKFNKLTGIYGFYFYYSQYEHFTEKTEELMTRSGSEEFKNLTIVIDYLLLGLFANLGTMQIDPTYLQKLDTIRNDFKQKFEK
jgi:hypothetical protein